MAKLLTHPSGRTFFIRDISKDYHCQYGMIAKKDLKKKSGTVKTNLGKELTIIEAGFIDRYRKMKRAPQIIPMKDLGSIMTETGIGKDSKCLDAGTGSGALALFLANICKEVVSYEIREDFHNLAKKNVESMEMKNLKLRLKDIYKGITEKNLDLVTLDLPEPWKVIPFAAKALKHGGFLVSYSPTVPQVADFVNQLSDDFIHVKTIEIIEREWDVEGRKVRPKSQQIGHSGFLSFCRKK